MYWKKLQHPLAAMILFLVIALAALILIIVANHRPVDTGSGGTPGPSMGFECERGTPKGFKLSDVEGHSVAEVERWAAQRGMTVRIVAEDGQSFAITADYSPDRINTQVEAGVVIRYCGNG